MLLLLSVACAPASITLDEGTSTGPTEATETDVDADTDTDADTDADTDTDPGTTPTEPDPVAVTFGGTVTGLLDSDWWATECAGEVTVTVEPDGAVSGTANCYLTEAYTDLAGDVTGEVAEGQFTGTWSVDLWNQPYDIALTGLVRGEEHFHAEFADVQDWFSFEGSFDATP